MKRIALAAAVAVAILGLGSSRAQADTIVFQQGFETNNAGWDAFGGSFDAPRVPSGTNGVTSASGSFHGLAHASATNWGGYNSVFPIGGYRTDLDIYLDLTGGAANDTRFDWDSAVSTSTGGFLRDFVFNGGFYNDTDATGTGNRFVFSASNNTGRANSFPKNPGRDPFAITTSGWYTFEHDFRDNGGVLAVDLKIFDALDNLLHTWTLSTPTDLIGANVGGNRYGWVVNNEFSSLAIDNSERANFDSGAAAVPEPASLMLLGSGLLVGYRRFRRQK
jgi:PEP-CTERM motif